MLPYGLTTIELVWKGLVQAPENQSISTPHYCLWGEPLVTAHKGQVMRKEFPYPKVIVEQNRLEMLQHTNSSDNCESVWQVYNWNTESDTQAVSTSPVAN